ncbi:MAG: DNA double-strand break repair nuclease NurA [candidate division WOR-3 bacterium]
MRVNSRFFESILSKWGSIREQFSGIEEFEGIDPQIVLSEWNEYHYKNNKSYKIVSGDGSYNTLEYIDKYVILSAGLGISFDENYNKDEKYLSFVIVIPFDVIVKKFLDDLASLIMATLELKSIYLISKEKSPDIVILDGSIRNFIIRFGPSHSKEIGQNWFYKGNLDERKIDELYYENKESIFEFDLWSYNIVKMNIKGDDKFIYFAHLLYYEYLKVLDELLKNFKVISISKSFSPTFENKIFPLINAPDIIIFNNYTKSVGYSSISYYLKDEYNIKWKLPEPFRHLEKKDINFFYARFEENYRVYKVEFIGNLNQEEILDVLHPFIISGYPYILKIAHSEVLISDKDAELFENYVKNEMKREIGLKLRSEL